MSLKKEAPARASAALNNAYKCGECLHHQVHTHPSMKNVCIKNGVKKFAIAPPCFTPDVTQLTSNTDTFVQVASILHDMTTPQKRVMFALLNQKPIKRRAFSRDLKWGMKVYFLAMGKDYFSNYLSGYVMGLTSSGELIIAGSPEQQVVGRSYIAYMTDDDNIMTPTEWKAKKAELRTANRIHDPSVRMMPKQDIAADPVTIDSAPDSWHDKREKVRKARRSDDLTIKIT